MFASYFAGRNEAAVDALRGLEPLGPPTCLYLHGAPATGKTHLLQAVCADAAARGLAAAYLPLRDLRSIGPELLAGWGELDIVCIDDIEQVALQPPWNRALFALHQQLEERRGRLLVTSRLAPAALGMTLRDLASRLAGGLVLTLQPLEEAERMRALQLRAQQRGFELPEETALLMLQRLPRDMTTLYGFLDRLDEASLVEQRRLTPRFVREILDR